MFVRRETVLLQLTSQWRPGFDLTPVLVKLVVIEVAVGQFCSKYFSFPCQYHSMMFHTHSVMYRRCYIMLAIDSAVKQ